MKHNETDYLNKLFASSSDLTDEAEVEIPQLEVPAGLSQRLYELAESDAGISAASTFAAKRRGNVLSFPKFAGIAASIFVAVMGFQFYQQQQTLSQLEQAQADLAIALHYLGEANRIARSQVIDSLNGNIKRAGVEPAMEIGRETLRDSLAPQNRDLEIPTQTHNRSL